MASDHSRPLYHFNYYPRVSNFLSRQFSRGSSGSHRSPKRSQGSPCNSLRDSEECDRRSRRLPFVGPVSDFCYPKKDSGSSCNSEFEENECVHSSSTFQNGNHQRDSAGSSQSRLGSFLRSKRRLPPCAGSPPVKKTVGVQVPRLGLHLQGSSFRPIRFPLGSFQESWQQS